MFLSMHLKSIYLKHLAPEGYCYHYTMMQPTLAKCPDAKWHTNKMDNSLVVAAKNPIS